MSKHTILLCVVSVLSWSVVSATTLVPPTGYSVGFTGVVQKGIQRYVCDDGAWTKTGSTSNVYGQDNTRIAKYWSVYDAKTKTTTYYWEILNSAGQTYEGGSSESGLQATTVTSVPSTLAVAEYLALVELHRGSGDGDGVAWVSLTGTGGGLPPCKSLCTSNGATSGVPFTGKFTFYTQDSQPPQVPAALTPPGTFVQTVFLKGKIMYRFQAGKWVYIGFFANITDVAGGNYLGKSGTTTGGSLKFLFRGPNGFSLTGQKSSSATMSAESCPWQLVKITAQTGNGSPFGQYIAALIGATYGGNPPALASKTENLEWGSLFTGQAYLFAQ